MDDAYVSDQPVMSDHLLTEWQHFPKQRDGSSCGVRALTCLRQAIQDKPCLRHIELSVEQSNLLSLIQRVHTSKFGADDIAVLHELRNKA